MSELTLLVLGFVILLLLIYITYQDISNRREREKLQLKLMSRNLEEYHNYAQKQDKEPNTKEKEEVYQDVDDVSIETLLKAKDMT